MSLRAQGKAFFPYCFQGHEVEDFDGTILEEFNGWLVPIEQEKEFEKRWAEVPLSSRQ